MRWWLAMVVAVLAFVGAPGAARAQAAAAAPAAAAPQSDASPVTVHASLSPDPSNVGDVLTYEITVTYPRDVTVNLPSVFTLDPLYIVSRGESEPTSAGDGLSKVFTIELQHFAAGEVEIPSFELAWVDASGAVQTVLVPAHTFTVESLLANEVEPERRGEDPPISREYPAKRAEMIIGAVAGTLALAGMIFALVYAFTSGPKRTFVPPPLPAHEQAYQALSELEGGELLARKQYEDYYVQLTEIAKGYLQGRFGVSALDRTTEEMRQMLERDAEQIAPLTPREVMAFLEMSDLFKFAGFEPREGEGEQALEAVREIVDRTAPAAGADKKPDEGADRVDGAAAASDTPPPAADLDEDEAATPAASEEDISS